MANYFIKRPCQSHGQWLDPVSWLYSSACNQCTFFDVAHEHRAMECRGTVTCNCSRDEYNFELKFRRLADPFLSTTLRTSREYDHMWWKLYCLPMYRGPMNWYLPMRRIDWASWVKLIDHFPKFRTQLKGQEIFRIILNVMGDSGGKTHICVGCEVPIAVYGRLSPCLHVYCLQCSSRMKTCVL